MAVSIFPALRLLRRWLMELAVILILLVCVWGMTIETNTEGQIRLVDGSSNCSGRVEIFHDDQWGTICHYRWDIKDARVICRQMGCGEARAAPTQASFGRGSGPIWLDNVHCTGNESTLHQCPAVRWGARDCNHGQDVGVVCSGGTLEFENEYKIRLVNSSRNCSGRVEVFHEGQWGTVCDDNWDITDARIVCQEMGCGDAKLAQSGSLFGEGTGPIWLDDVHCTGTESALNQCPANRWEDHNCHHGEDASVICSGNQAISRWSLWVPALCVLLATALLGIGGIIWYLRSKRKGDRRYEVPIETMDVSDEMRPCSPDSEVHSAS